MFCFPLQLIWDLTIHPLRGSASLLAHHLVFGSNTHHLVLANITHAFPFELPFNVFKIRMLGRGFHTLVKNVLFPSPTNVGSHNPSPFGIQPPCWHISPTDVGSHNSSPFGVQPPCWHITRCLALIPFVTAQVHR